MDIRNEIKNFENIERSWNTLLDNLGVEGDDFEILAIRPRQRRRYFHARAVGRHIFIGEARYNKESAEISSERTIDFNQFRCVAELYNAYVSGIEGIRPTMRDNCSQNTSYIISLIGYLL